MRGTASIPGWYVEFQAAMLCQMPRPGEIDQITAEGWTKNQRALKGALASGLLPPTPPVEPTEKFALLVDLGIITVPDDYDHARQLTRFGNHNLRKFNYYHRGITDENFPNPSHILKPGDRLRVRAFKQVVDGTTTSEERMDFLRSQGAVFTGAQGASLVFEQKRDQLPKGKWYASFDEEERLWYAGGYRRVPHVIAYWDGGFDFGLGSFGDVWGDFNAFLCFTKV